MRLECWACACMLLLACTDSGGVEPGWVPTPGDGLGATGGTGASTSATTAPSPAAGDAGSVPTTGADGSTAPSGDASVVSPDAGSTASADAGSTVAPDAGDPSDSGMTQGDASADADTTGPDAGDAAPDTDAGPAGMVLAGCGDSTLLPLPEDPTERGPWPVGEKTVSIGRLAAVEVFYPAVVGSQEGEEEIAYDMRMFLPESERDKVPLEDATINSAGTYRDLPLDDTHGPYPVVIFVHGTASFRLGSFHTQALWASRGFVVVAADHPGLYLADYLATNGCRQDAPEEDLSADMDAEIAALTSAAGDLAFLSGHIDMQRLALSGHSAGAVAVANASGKPGVQVVMPLAGTRAVGASSTLKSVLFVAGIDDEVLAYRPFDFKLGNLLYPGSDTAAYNDSPGPSAVRKRLIGMTEGGHLNVTDLCFTKDDGRSDLEVAEAQGVCGVDSVLPLADCGAMEPVKGLEITNAATTAVLEETLQCQDRASVVDGLQARFPEIGDFKQEI